MDLTPGGKTPFNTPSRKLGGDETVGPSDPIFHQHDSSNLPGGDDITRLPKGAVPPGAHYDPVSPLENQPAGPNRDEPRPSGLH